MHNSKSNALVIREAQEGDVPAMYRLILELAQFEQATEKVTNTEAQLREDGFGEHPCYQCFVAVLEEEIIGMALTYYRYSTWKGRCVYLEDLIVTEKHRSMGVGSQLIDRCLAFAHEENCALVMWQVLDWNTRAIEFYKSRGARLEPEWVNCVVPIAKEKPAG